MGTVILKPAITRFRPVESPTVTTDVALTFRFGANKLVLSALRHTANTARPVPRSAEPSRLTDAVLQGRRPKLVALNAF